MLQLTDPWFEAQFYGSVSPDGGRFTRQGAKIDGGQGLFLWCPCAYNGSARMQMLRHPDGYKGDARAHGLLVPFANPRNAPALPSDHGPTDRERKGRPRWTMSGSGLEDLTITPSIDVGPPPGCWHGFITAGEVR